MNEDRLKSLVRSKKHKFGHLVAEFATPGIGHILKAAGCDFAFFDLEHSGFGFETVKSAVRYFEAADLPLIVRVPSNQYHHISRALDVGAEGLMVPMVGTVEEARHIINSMKFTPEGSRGAAVQVAHDRYRTGVMTDKFAAANRRSTLFCEIETCDGVKNVNAIAALPDVDGLWIGDFDLSVSLGIPNQFGAKKFTDAIKRITEAAQTHGKALGRVAFSIEQGLVMPAQGFNFICYSGDVWVLRDALSDAISRLRQASRGLTLKHTPAAKSGTGAGKPRSKKSTILRNQ